MKLELDISPTRLRALPVQLVETEDGVILRRGCEQMKVVGSVAAEVVHIVLTVAVGDGASAEEICECFAAPMRPMVNDLIQALISRRILISNDSETGTKDVETNLDVFYWHFADHAERVADRINNKRIAILGVNCISRQLVASLAASGVRNLEVVDHPFLRNVLLFGDDDLLASNQWPHTAQPPIAFERWADDLESVDCLVATSDFGEQQMMREWNQFCVKYNHQFFPVVLKDLVGYVGPLVVPGETACFECLRARQNAHLEDPSTQRAAEGEAFNGQHVNGFHPAMASVLGDIAAIEMTKFYGGPLPNPKVGTLIEVNLLNTQMIARRVLKVPRCDVCGTVNNRSSASPNKTIFLPGNPNFE